MSLLYLGRFLVISSIAMMFLSYANFLPTALGSGQLADYIKNHFVREVIFGLALAVTTIFLTFWTTDPEQWVRVAILGSIVVLPFWLGAIFGWSTGGLAEVWDGAIEAQTAYRFHTVQTVLFYLGLGVLYAGVKSWGDLPCAFFLASWASRI